MSYAVSGVLWAADRLEVQLAHAGHVGPVDLVLEAIKPGQPSLVAGAEVCVWSRQSNVPPEIVSRLRGITARLVATLPFHDLERMVALDTDAVESRQPPASPGTGEPPVFDGISLPSAARHALTAPEFYADFFAAPELRRAGCDIVDVHSAHSLVSHGDVECSYCAICVPSPRSSLLRLPVYETVRNIGRSAEARGTFDESEDPTNICSSDLTEHEVIMGAPGKIEKVLRYADRTRLKDKLMFVGQCLPDVIGEDQDAAVKEYGTLTDTPVFVVPASPRSWEWLAKDLLSTRRKALPLLTDPAPCAINLVGFAQNAGTREMVELLSALGVSVHTSVLPVLDMDAVARIPGAPLNVYVPNTHWEKAYAHLRDDDALEHLVMDAPYGPRCTQQWLERICSALDLRCDVGALCRARFEPLLPRWEVLRQSARNVRLGLAVAAADVDALLEARFSWGVPLAAVIEEMGFGLDVFIGGSRAEMAAEKFRARTSLAPSSFEMHTVDGLEGLIEAMVSSRCSAVFSNYVFDWRLVRAGKAPFSTLEFEMGLRGAVATLERLLTAGQLPLFQAGRRFLGRGLPFGGADDRRG